MKLFCFGLGYSAQTLVRLHGHRFSSIAGTVRSAEKANTLQQAGVNAVVFTGGAPTAALADALSQADALLVSAAPDDSGDPMLTSLAPWLAKTNNLHSIIYWSTVGVYGDHQGQWIDESTSLNAVSPRGKRRIAAESAWQVFCATQGIPLQVHRLAGIYGPGRSVLDELKAGTARRIIKAGQVFNRIHVDDIAGAAAAGFMNPKTEGAFNICDDEPCPPQDVVTYAAGLMKIPPPPAIPFQEAHLSEMGRSFYSESKRCKNHLLKDRLGYGFLYPTYREGLTALHAKMEKMA